MTTNEPLCLGLNCQPQTGMVEQLALATGLEAAAIADAMHKGAVWLRRGRHRRRLRADEPVRKGDRLEINYDARILALIPPTPVCISDRTDFSAWYKPPGVQSSGTRFADHHAIDRLVTVITGRETHLVHRLDRFTRGVMVLAHSRSASADLSAQFAARTVGKVYEAVVQGDLTAAVTVETPIDDKAATTVVTPLITQAGLSLVRAEPGTGRKHQVRRHLAALGHPVVGDRQYGGGDAQDLQLAAVSLSFTAPGSDERVTARIPDEYRLQLP